MSALSDFIRDRMAETSTYYSQPTVNNWRPSQSDRQRITAGMTGRYGAHSGTAAFNSLSMPNIGGLLSSPAVLGTVGGAVAGLPGLILGRALAGRLGGDEDSGPEMQRTSRGNLNDLEDSMGLSRRGFTSYRGSGGNVIGLIDPGSLGIYEGSGHDRSRAPQTSADRQMR